MNKGEIIQIGTPQELYNKPVSYSVHNFLGESNFTKVAYRDGKVYAEGDTTQPLPCTIQHMDQAVKLATRPSEIESIMSLVSRQRLQSVLSYLNIQNTMWV